MLFQAAWWGTALLARDGHESLAILPVAAFVVLEVARAKRRAPVALLAVTAALLGLVVDGALTACGFIHFAFDLAGWPSAPFMVVLWAAFACTLFTSLERLTRAPFVAVAVGAVGGALAYRGAASLGVLSLGSGSELASLGAIAVAWGLATPALAGLAGALLVDKNARRARTIPRLFALTAVVAALLPLLFVSAVVVDVVRFIVARVPFMALRMLAFLLVYLAAECAGVVVLACTRGPRSAYALQTWWTYTLFRATRAIFRLRFVVDGDACVGPRTLVLLRHASIIDTLVPSVFVTRAHGVKLRFVVKKELLEDPCLDIAGNRLPNHFAARNAEDTDADLAAITKLARDCGADEGLLIYPEGTRFTERKRLHLVAQIKDEALAARARSLVKLLPPKPAGVSALLDGAPAADAIFVGHTGLEGFAHVDDIFSGALLGRTVYVTMWRVPRREIPDGKDARSRWLYDQWARMDTWISSTH